VGAIIPCKARSIGCADFCTRKRLPLRLRSNALMATELSTSIGWPETGFEEISGDFLEADLNEAALRRTHSRVVEPTVEVI